jgi:ribosomal protein L29
MALLRYNEIEKMSNSDRELKLKDLMFELSKAGVTANRTNAKTKELKRAIARVLTFITSEKNKGVMKLR